MCFLAASECLQLCMTLLLASLHRAQTEKRRLRARLSALSLSLSLSSLSLPSLSFADLSLLCLSLSSSYSHFCTLLPVTPLIFLLPSLAFFSPVSLSLGSVSLAPLITSSAQRDEAGLASDR